MGLVDVTYQLPENAPSSQSATDISWQCHVKSTYLHSSEFPVGYQQILLSNVIFKKIINSLGQGCVAAKQDSDTELEVLSLDYPFLSDIFQNLYSPDIRQQWLTHVAYCMTANPRLHVKVIMRSSHFMKKNAKSFFFGAYFSLCQMFRHVVGSHVQ